MTNTEVDKLVDEIDDLFDDNGYALNSTQAAIIKSVIKDAKAKLDHKECRYERECVYSCRS